MVLVLFVLCNNAVCLDLRYGTSSKSGPKNKHVSLRFRRHIPVFTPAMAMAMQKKNREKRRNYELLLGRGIGMKEL